MLRKTFYVLFLLVFILSGCRRQAPYEYAYQKTAYGANGMVVSAHPLATQSGLQILQAGGNAVDASIAVYLALAVVYPRAGNIGGGGFMIYRGAQGETAALDFREKAPKGATRNMYLDVQGNVIPGSSTTGDLATGVPGSVAGLVAAYNRYGSLPWKDLCKRAILLAREGHPITGFEADRLNATREMFITHNGDGIPFVSDRVWKEGDMLRQPDLANTLERISNEGRDGFYSGKTAEYLINEMQSGGGLMTMNDLEEYTAVWRKPITSDYRGYHIICMPPPSSGGIALSQLLSIVEQFPLNAWGHRDTRTIHLMVEAERRVYADRATYLGDDDFYPVPADTLMDSTYLSVRMHDFKPDKASNSTDVSAGDIRIGIESTETTHFTVVDSMGNAVAITTTLNSSYGNKVFVDGAGFLLNNEMDDFSVKPGSPNLYGLVGGEANAIAPGKRMLSSMTPTIVEKDGEFFMTVGSPGGSKIITSVFQVFLNVVEFDMSASEAVSVLRFHHQWLPDEISYEKGCFSEAMRTTLTGMGHHLNELKEIGLVEVILSLPDGRYEGAADPRGSDAAEGF